MEKKDAANKAQKCYVPLSMWQNYRKTFSVSLRNEIVERNWGLVRYVCDKISMPAHIRDDAEQEGRIALLKAVETYDPGHGSAAQFHTYAIPMIRGAIFRFLHVHSRDLRIPGHVGSGLNRLSQAKTRLAATLGRVPHEDELAAEMRVCVAEVRKLDAVSDLIRILSLERPNSVTQESLGSQIASGDGFEDHLLDSVYLDQMYSALFPLLSEMQQVMLRGLVEGKKVAEIARGLNVSAPRASEIKKATLKRVRQYLAVHHNGTVP